MKKLYRKIAKSQDFSKKKCYNNLGTAIDAPKVQTEQMQVRCPSEGDLQP